MGAVLCHEHGLLVREGGAPFDALRECHVPLVVGYQPHTRGGRKVPSAHGLPDAMAAADHVAELVSEEDRPVAGDQTGLDIPHEGGDAPHYVIGEMREHLDGQA